MTPKDTRPRFCNPSSLSSHSVIYSFARTDMKVHSLICKPAEEQICTPTHTSAYKMIVLLCWHTQAGATLSVSFTPIPPELQPSSASALAFSSPPSLHLSHLHRSSPPHISLASFPPPALCSLWHNHHLVVQDNEENGGGNLTHTRSGWSKTDTWQGTAGLGAGMGELDELPRNEQTEV